MAEACGVWPPPFPSAVRALWLRRSASLYFLTQGGVSDSATEGAWALKRSQALAVCKPLSVWDLACPVY